MILILKITILIIIMMIMIKQVQRIVEPEKLVKGDS